MLELQDQVTKLRMDKYAEKYENSLERAPWNKSKEQSAADQAASSQTRSQVADSLCDFLGIPIKIDRNKQNLAVVVPEPDFSRLFIKTSKTTFRPVDKYRLPESHDYVSTDPWSGNKWRYFTDWYLAEKRKLEKALDKNPWNKVAQKVGSSYSRGDDWSYGGGHASSSSRSQWDGWHGSWWEDDQDHSRHGTADYQDRPKQSNSERRCGKHVRIAEALARCEYFGNPMYENAAQKQYIEWNRQMHWDVLTKTFNAIERGEIVDDR